MPISRQFFTKTLRIYQCCSLRRTTLRCFSSSSGNKTDIEQPIPLEVALAKPEEIEAKKRLAMKIDVKSIVDITPINGVPSAMSRERRARIYKNFKNAMQSGTSNLNGWHLEFDNNQRWENPLMGWTSSGDPLSSLQLDFNTIDEAIDYCEKNRYNWFIDEPPKQKPPKQRSYAMNFSFDKRTRLSTK